MTNRIDTAAERAKLAALEGHTPGPWRKHGNGRHVTSDTDLVALAVAGPIKHNTRLIAASPDLISTLSTALGEIDRLRAALAKIDEARLEGWRAGRDAAVKVVDELEEYWLHLAKDSHAAERFEDAECYDTKGSAAEYIALTICALPEPKETNHD